MDFDFSSEQYMFQESVRGLLEQSFDFAAARKLVDGEGDDAALWAKLAETGIFSMLVPEQHGGLGLSFVDLSLVIEEFGRALVPASAIETIAATDALVRYGTAHQQEQWLPQIAAGKLKLACAFAETENGFDVAPKAVVARRNGAGWTLGGRKILVPHAAIADLILVSAAFEGGASGLVLLEKGRKGLSLKQHTTLDLLNRYHEVTFDQLAVTEDDILGGKPLPAAVARLADVQAMLAATLLMGIATKVLDTAVTYATQRTQFGKLIGSFQAIKHRCADMAVMIDASRSAAYYAAWAVAEEAGDRAKAVSIAKSYCGDAARYVCNEGIQLHGGIGFTWELGLHFYLRRTKMLEQVYGDANLHRERVLAATLAGAATL